MTNYTIREDAETFIARFAQAPDLASHANLMDELKERYTTLAAQTQMLAESNERWATKERDNRISASSMILELADEFVSSGDDIPGSLQRLANLLDIALEETFRVEITLTYCLDVVAPRGTSEDAIQSAIEWSSGQTFTSNDPAFEIAQSWSMEQDDYSVSVETI
jgi:hypothetical protein